MRGLKLMVLLALCWATLSGGTIIRSKVAFGSKEMVNVWYLQDRNARWDTGEEHSFIYTSSNNMLKVLDWTKKTYFEMKIEALEKFLKDIEAKQKEIKEKVTKKLGPFSKLKKEVKEEEPAEIKKVGTEEVAGFTCDVYEVSIGGITKWKFWTTDPANIGINVNDFKLSKKIGSFFDALTKKTTEGKEKIENYPVKNIFYDKGGNVVFSQELVDVKDEEIEGSTFQVPEGFQQMKMPTNPFK